MQRFTAFYFLANRRGRGSFYFEDFTNNATTRMHAAGDDGINAMMRRPLGDFRPIESQVANNLGWTAAA